MRCIAVPNEYTQHHDFSKATKICSSLREITPELLDALASAPIKKAADSGLDPS